MGPRSSVVLSLLTFVVPAVLLSSIFTVNQRQYAIIFQLGEVKDVIKSPGLYLKFPVIQNINFFDNRILTLNPSEPERFLTSEKQPVLVDSFVKWRISDVEQYYISVNGDERLARTRLSQVVNSGLREEFGRRTLKDVISGERAEIMTTVQRKADLDMRTIGVEVVDVRLKRVELPAEVLERVYRRMETERKRVANAQRAQGAAEAERIRAEADKQRSILLATAYRDAEKTRGEGDAQAADISAKSYGQDPDFYGFYRRMEAYKTTLGRSEDILVIDGDSDFFKYLKKSK